MTPCENASLIPSEATGPELASTVGRRVWLWHEPSLTHALTVLWVTQCDVVLLSPEAVGEPRVEMAGKVQRLAPGATVMPYGQVASSLGAIRGQRTGGGIEKLTPASRA